jgi:micrococcal nuclease
MKQDRLQAEFESIRATIRPIRRITGLSTRASIQYTTRDRYGRIIGTVMLAGQNINSRMISTGRAWHYKKYSKSPALASLESTARANGLGLWSTPTPVAPWTFRKR